MPLTFEQISDIIETHKGKGDQERQQFDKYNAWYNSEFWQDAQDGRVPTGSFVGDEMESDLRMETNYAYAYTDTMVANICPTNPQITITARDPLKEPAAKYREALVNDRLTATRAYRRLWGASTKASVLGRAFIKTTWRQDRQTVAFYVRDPRLIFYDLCADEWEDIRYLCEVTVLTKEEYEARTKKLNKKKAGPKEVYDPKIAKMASFDQYPDWTMDKARSTSVIADGARDVYQWTTVYEFYDFPAQRYYHFLDGVHEPLFQGDLPYRFQRNPFHKIVFNDNLRDTSGLSDVKLIAPVLERLNEIDTLELLHAHASIPIMLVQSGLCDNPEAITTALRKARTPGDLVNIQGKERAPLRDIIGNTPTPSLNPTFNKQRDKFTHIIEFLLAIPQYSRGQVGVADVATEVALADTATRTRNGRRQKEVEEAVVFMSKAIVNLYEEFLPPDSVLPVRLTGSDEMLHITRDLLMARQVGDHVPNEEPLDYDYAVVPYSPAENSKLMQIRNMQAFAQLLMADPNVDKAKFIRKLLDYMGLQDLFNREAGAMQPGPGPGRPPGFPQGELPTGEGEDTIATGALPPGSAVPPTPPLPAGGPGSPAPALPSGPILAGRPPK